MENNNTIPYGQHYRCFPQMIGSTTNQSVFMYLMDEYSHRLKDGRALSFPISMNEIAADRNMSWRAVSSSLYSLQKMKLILIENNEYTIDGDFFMSLIIRFSSITGRDEKMKFAKAVHNNDEKTLIEMGFVFIKNSKSKMFLDSNIDNQQKINSPDELKEDVNGREQALMELIKKSLHFVIDKMSPDDFLKLLKHEY